MIDSDPYPVWKRMPRRARRDASAVDGLGDRLR